LMSQPQGRPPMPARSLAVNTASTPGDARAAESHHEEGFPRGSSGAASIQGMFQRGAQFGPLTRADGLPRVASSPAGKWGGNVVKEYCFISDFDWRGWVSHRSKQI
jgi:hypothetical protein